MSTAQSNTSFDASRRTVAIVGLGACMPDAPNVATFWQNILSGHVAIGEVPDGRWRKDLYHSADRTLMDRTYSTIGGFIRYDHFNPKQFRIMPRSLHAIDDVQKLALMVVAEALRHAGYQVFPKDADGKPFDRERCAIIMGNTLGGEFEDRTSLRIWMPEIEAALRASAAAEQRPQAEIDAYVTAFRKHYEAQLPTVTEDSMPGELPNCITGRIANVFDLRGPNFTTDAACASSMAALQAGVHGLLAGDYDVALVGGADRSMDPPSYVKFCRIGALSAEHSAPFDARANGFVMGEGAGILVLRRLEDAIANKDTIYSVIRGIGASSDGRGKGMTAPNPIGQRLAVQRAWQDAGLSIAQAGLIEAHGTSTPVGDHVEAEVLTSLLKEAGHTGAPVPLGSVKSMIGHLKSASGAASLIKTTLALHHRTLPPSANFIAAKPSSPLHEGKLEVVTQARHWPEGPGPRRAGISAFGFGGTNSHVVLEAYEGPQQASVRSEPAAKSNTVSIAVSSKPSVAALTDEVVALFAQATGYCAQELDLDHHLEADLGIDSIKQAEVLALLRQKYRIEEEGALRLSDLNTLRATINYVQERAEAAQGAKEVSLKPTAPDASNLAPAASPKPAKPCILAFYGASLAEALAHGAQAAHNASSIEALANFDADALLSAPARIAFVAASLQDAHSRLNDAKGKSARLLAARGIFTAEGAPLAHSGDLAFVFPGQGSQYLGMLQDLAEAYPIVARTFEEADAILKPLLGAPLSSIVWPEHINDANDLRLRETQVCQPAMLCADVALTRLLASLGISPKRVAGHSLGEYAAAVAAGVMSFADALYAVSARGREMAEVKVDDPGKMAMVALDFTRVDEVLQKAHGYVIAANKNCHTQTVIAGASLAVDEALLAFSAQGIEARQIPVSHAFHSAIVAPAAEPLRRVLAGLSLNAPKIPLCANVDANYYPQDKAAIVDLMARQLASPVEFIGQIERLYADNVRMFVEVGPKRALTGFVRNILGQRKHLAIASNHPKKTGVLSFLELLAALVVDGVPVRDAAAQAMPATNAPQPRPAEEMAASSNTKAAPSVAANAQPVVPSADQRVVISGLAVALPRNEAVTPLDQDAFAPLLRGENLIEPIDPAQRDAIAGLNVTRFDKEGGRFVSIDGGDDVMQLVGKLGDIDLAAYGIDPTIIGALDVTGRLAIAMGIDALRDAGLPLVRRMRQTSTGTKLFDRWGLPPELSRRTGVILASAFPGFDAVAEEMQRCYNPGPNAAPYAFDRKWLFRALSLGHAQLAQAIMAQGPNTQINAACASGSQALGIASDWLRADRCDRVIVVTADNITQDATLPWFGAGFLAVGSASVEADVTKAAVPFGKDRNGMILGSGAAAFVVEKESHVQARGMVPLAELVAADFANSAFHGTRLEPGFIGEFVGGIVDKLARRRQKDVSDLAKEMVFVSHETYTPARGGSSAAEVTGLRHVFGNAVGDVTIANTKGFTGHPMGASLEDAAAIKGLQRQSFPPVANLNHIDPTFADLTFSRGGPLAAQVAVRFAAGFGSQVAATAYCRRATQEARLVDEQAYMTWCASLSMPQGCGLILTDRTLRLVDEGGALPHTLGVASLQVPAPNVPADALGVQITPAEPNSMSCAAPAAAKPEAQLQSAPAGTSAAAPEHGDTLQQLTALFSQQTGYDTADLDPNHALEADLGIDSVKQAEIFAIMRERFALAHDPDFRLSDVQSLVAAAKYVDLWRTRSAVEAAPDQTQASLAEPQIGNAEPQGQAEKMPETATLSLEAVTKQVVETFAQETGYDVADLDPALALEADLGIDSIKQAEILAALTARYQIPQTSELRLSEVQSIGALARYIYAHVNACPSPPDAPPPGARAQPAASTPAAAPQPQRQVEPQALIAELTAVFAEHTGYDAADLGADHLFEADLGIDSVKQAEIFALVRERYAMGADEAFRPAEVQTLTALADYVRQGKAPQAAVAAVAAPDFAAPHQAKEPAAVENNQAASVVDTAGFEARAVGLLPLAVAPITLGAKPQGIIWLVGEHGAPGTEAAHEALKAAGANVEVVDAAAAHEALTQSPQAVVMVVEDLVAADDPEGPCHRLFTVLRHLARQPQQPKQLMVVGRNSHGFGVIKHAETSQAAQVQVAALTALSGMVKSVAKEWLGCACRVVDVVSAAPSTLTWPDVVGRALALWGGDVVHAPREIVIVATSDGNHYSTLTRHQGDVKPRLRPLPHHGKVVATGGARGVTFALLMELARKRPLDITILARTAPLKAHESPIALCDDNEARAIAKRNLEHDGVRITPASVRQWIARLKERVMVAQNIAALEAFGCRVRLLPCDVSVEQARGEAIAQITADKRPVALLLHGAGIEESRFIKDKDATALARTFAPKATSLRHFMQALSPQRTVTMGSIAGRFGNGGQADYAAANEMMAGLARLPGSKMLNLAWTAWADVGMATRGSVGQVLQGLGVKLLPQEVGVALGSALIESDTVGDLVVAGDLGDLCAPELPWPALFESSQLLEAKTPQDGGPQQQGVRLVRTLDPMRDRGLDDHRIDGVPYLPGVLGMELMQQAGEAVLGRDIRALTNVRFEAPVKFFFDKPLALQLEVRCGLHHLHLSLFTERTAPSGTVQRKKHFSAKAPLSAGPMPSWGENPPVFHLMGAPPKTLSQSEIYSRYFHGESFQVLAGEPHIDDFGGTAKGLLPSLSWLGDLHAQDAHSVPWATEAAFQAAGLYEMAQRQRMALPSQVDKIWLAPAERTHVSQVAISVRVTAIDEAGCVFDLLCQALDGPGETPKTVISFIEGYRSVVLHTLKANECLQRAGKTEVREVLSDVSLCSLPLAEVEPLLKPQADAALSLLLSPKERTHFATLTVRKRRLEWLAGRLVAKRVILASWMLDGPAPGPDAIVIAADAAGAPQIDVVGRILGPNVPLLSVSHGAGRAIAMVSWQPAQLPGIDVEEVAERVPAFATTYFTLAEQARAKQDAEPSRMLTAMWAVKEATGKALGLGTRLDYLSVEALPNEGPKAGTALTWRLAATPQSAPMLADRSLDSAHVVVTFDGSLVQAEVVLAATESVLAHHGPSHSPLFRSSMTHTAEKFVS